MADEDNRIADDAPYISDVADFDVCGNAKVAYLTTDGALWYTEQDYGDVAIEAIRKAARQVETGDHAVRTIALYNGGLALLYESGDAYVRGYEFHYDLNRDVLQEKTLRSGARGLFSSQYSLSVIDRDGGLVYFGVTPSGSHNTIFSAR